MSFSSFSEFLTMGKHGFYVWPAYGITLSILIGILWYSVWSRRRYLESEARRLRREEKQ